MQFLEELATSLDSSRAAEAKAKDEANEATKAAAIAKAEAKEEQDRVNNELRKANEEVKAKFLEPGPPTFEPGLSFVFSGNFKMSSN